MQVDFYHLTSPLDRVLPRIAERVVQTGGRLLIVAEPEEQRVALDRLLWSYASESFLPHAQAGSNDDAAQPILIADDIPETAPANAARNVAIVDGRWRDLTLTFDRAFHIFDDEAIREARLAWKALADRDGVERRYWKQNDSGRWEQAA
ncbi:DNA polymerase III chi subunit [Sphingomonas sp. PP-F2F-A104-K0414]|uniref:DNA polymerase III subunit chi n=1 Tax=Sphingomonas sp. PP-F2F-A104-K0414 TaxID=2135661 RepID=UPI0010466BB3|nr:DNA polymerase III subunit chi [Sphingomonas sp. PP-F2F-A104-K0414]TCQ00719.1 DNA polymerase III chi subunit [Sphingomonas sp. PP-F2F-A104-K0414]